MLDWSYFYFHLLLIALCKRDIKESHGKYSEEAERKYGNHIKVAYIKKRLHLPPLEKNINNSHSLIHTPKSLFFARHAPSNSTVYFSFFFFLI